MKKNLLTLGLLAFTLSASAQVLTYVGDGAKMYVSSGALVYSGGDWEVNSAAEKTVENRGNIIIVGDYKKGTVTNAASDGKEFLNVYTGTNDYGQVKILNSAGNTNARMAIQRPAASSNYYGTIFGISFPYKDPVTYVMKSFGLNESDFKGTCPVGASCPNRYKMTLEKWNNDKVYHDAVVTNSTFTTGDYYSINLREANMQQAMTGIISYKGTPNPAAYTATGKSVIDGQSEASFSNLAYNDWKTKVNVYGEEYQSYLGYYDSTSKTYGKNVYRFGNPYTSNLDLSAIDGGNAWLKILNNGGATLKGANGTMIKDFYITKRTANYNIDWSPVSGSTNVNADYYKARLDENSAWQGNAEALLIRPFETFNLNFPTISPSGLGNTRIVNVKVDFNDNHKTFAYTPVGPISTGGKVANRSADTVVSNPDSFYQAEIFLTKDDSVLATPVYLVGSNYYQESSQTSSNSNGIFVYGSDAAGNIAYDSKKDINEFNSLEYVGKPLGVGFNNLTSGEVYELRFNLYEGSIFNKVKNLSDGAFYLLDKNNEQVTEISADKSYAFSASDNMDTRFEIYWKEMKPTGSLNTGDVVKGSTVVYKDLAVHKVRFEKSSSKANIEVYDMSGKLVLKDKDITTANDYVIDLPNKAVYVIKVIYQNGDVRTLKMIN